MNHLIMNAFAFKENFQTSMNLEGKGSEMIDVYMKNIFVSLCSAKEQNPEDTVMLVTNAAVPEQYEKQYAAHGIEIQIIPFQYFVMPKEFPWALAFFKLCALKTMVEKGEYDNILLLDADTYTVHPYENLWQEAAHGLLLYPVGHDYTHRDRETIRKDFVKFFPKDTRNIVHYGGEFICGNKKDLQTFIKHWEMVYDRMKEVSFQMEKNAGDETILSIAAAFMPEKVIAATPYMYRFWTGDFYLVSTVTVSNPVNIWHIPNEKETGFVRLYHYYWKKGGFPPVEKAAAIFGIVKAKRPWNFSTIQNKVWGKLRG